MKVLLSVFECDPYKGSDSYVGWSYAVSLAKYHDVYALTRTENKESIEHYLLYHSAPELQNIHFIYVDRSRFFSEFLYRFNRYLGFLGSYMFWQKAAYRKAVKLCMDIPIDLSHHISIADFRCAGYLWKLGKPFIFGPVGGGQETPECLKDYIVGHKKEETIRAFLNRFLVNLPSYKQAIRHASLIYTSNDETKACILNCISNNTSKPKVIRLTELCISDEYLIERKNIQKEQEKLITIIVSGRLICRKGVSLLLDAIKEMKTKRPFLVQVFGDGDQKEALKQKAEVLGIADKVVFYGKIGFEDMQKRYRDGDIYVLPSLRESTGTAVFEAMANKLPVVTLKQNGAKYVVEDDAGILVEVTEKRQVIADMASALDILVEDYDLRTQLGERGYEKIAEKYTWSRRINYMNKVYTELLLRG